MKKIITRENSKIHYDYFGRQTRKYRVIKEYPKYYLCECIYKGIPLYRECFLKIEVDGVIEVPVAREKYKGTGCHL